MSVVAVREDGPALLDGFRSVTGDGPLRTLEGLAQRLRGHRVVMVNSTSTGGGVAEILHRLVRLLLELGVPTTWEVMSGDPRFYGITKTLHNRLHGWPGAIGALAARGLVADRDDRCPNHRLNSPLLPPALCSSLSAAPVCFGFGSGNAYTTRAMPAWMRAFVQAGVRPRVEHGSSVM